MSEDLNKHLDAAIATLEAIVSDAYDDIGAAHQEGGKATEADHEGASALYSQLRAVTDLRARLQAAEERETQLLDAVAESSTALCGTWPRERQDAAWAVGKVEKITRACLAERARAEAAEERAEKVEVAMLNVQQQCENAAFNLRQKPTGALSNKEAVAIFDRLATTLRLSALKTEGA